jgi:drug/metabolite transporter (DMT)-like permease
VRRIAIRSARAWPLSGYSAAAVVVLIVASYPVATRAVVTDSFAPQDLVLLRFGVGALLFLPYLALHFRSIRREAWLRGVPLTLFQGAGMAALVICGLQFAPANHAAALGPGVAPAWVALLGFLVFSRRPSARTIVGAALCAIGVATLATWSASAAQPDVLKGDAMFLAASALGALYVLQLRNWKIGAVQGAAIVTLYSALVVVPWHLWSASRPLWQVVAPHEFFSQVLWQGVLIGCIALVALNHAIARLGPERASALFALVPALSAVLGLLFLGEIPSNAEIAAILAISIGVTIGASRSYGGSPAASSAAVIRPACGLSRPG